MWLSWLMLVAVVVVCWCCFSKNSNQLRHHHHHHNLRYVHNKYVYIRFINLFIFALILIIFFIAFFWNLRFYLALQLFRGYMLIAEIFHLIVTAIRNSTFAHRVYFFSRKSPKWKNKYALDVFIVFMLIYILKLLHTRTHMCI